MLDKIKRELTFVRGNFLVLVLSYSLFSFSSALAWPFESPFIESLGAPPFVIGLVGFTGSLMLFHSANTWKLHRR